MRDEDYELLRRFLLGELAENEAEILERRLLQEDALFEHCEAIEGELLAASVRNELTPADNERLLKRITASPGGRARLALARDLAAYAGTSQAAPVPAPLPFRTRDAAPPRRTFRWAAMAAGLLFAAAGASWLWMSPSPEPASRGGEVKIVHGKAPEVTMPREAPAAPAPLPAAPEETPAESPAPPEPAPVPDRPEPAPRLATAVFELALSTLRSSGELPQRFEVPKGAGQVEIQLDLGGEEEYRLFNALVRSSRAIEVWSRKGLEPQPLNGGTALILDIPADRLPDGRYSIEVQGVTAEGGADPIGFQEFEVVAE